jgi:chemotaxis protein MotB
MSDEEPSPHRVPDWFVSFADMMTLLMTFFIMIISFSETRHDAYFTAVAEQLQQQFGKDLSRLNLDSSEILARHAGVAKGAGEGRSKREQLLGADARVRMIRPGEHTALGTVAFFDYGSAELTQEARRDIENAAIDFAGKPQKIEVRGHTSLHPAEKSNGSTDNLDLAYQRSRAVMQYLTDELEIDPQRIRLAVAGANEPLHLGIDPARMRENPRVELYLLEEVVSDLTGTAEERSRQFAPAEGN